MGTVLIFSSVPMLVFVLIGGVAVDRFSRGRLMLLSDIMRGVIVTLVSVLAFAGYLEIWHVYAASILFGFISAFFNPAYTAIVPEITPSPLLPSANSLTSLSGQLTGILGPALGAVIVQLGGTSVAFALDAASFFISAATLLPIIGMLTQSPGGRSTSVLRELTEGVHAVAAFPWLWITILLAAFMNLTQAGPWSVALPFLVRDRLGADVGLLGLLYSSFSLGSVLGAVWLGHAKQLSHRGLVSYLGLVAWGLATVVVGLALPIPVLIAAAFCVGASLNVFNLIWINTLQEMVPRQLLGRVSSIDALGSFALLPVGYGLTGWAVDWIGAPAVLVVGGALTASLAGLGLLHPAIRRLD